MNSRPFELNDLPEISEWFASVEWPLPLTENLMPEIGIVVEDEGELVSCGWLYTTGTALAVLSWTGTNPNMEKAKRAEGFDVMVSSLQKVIKQKAPNIKCLLVMTKSEGLESQLKKHGFRSKKGYALSTWLADIK